MPALLKLMIDTLPDHALLLIIAVIALNILGWITALVLGFRRRWWLVAPLLIPFFYPFTLLVLCIRRAKHFYIPVVAHLLGLVVWLGGSAYLRSSEWSDLMDLEKELIAEGHVLNPAKLHGVEEADPNANVWDHPMLKTLAQAATPGRKWVKGEIIAGAPEGEEARKLMEVAYAWSKVPEIPHWATEYEVKDNAPVPMHRPLETLYDLALALRPDQEETGEGTADDTRPSDLDATLNGYLSDDPFQEPPLVPFESMESIHEILVPFFAKAEPKLEDLNDAVSRMQDVYPYHWSEGPGMLLPHLSFLEDVHILATRKGLHHVYNDEAEKAFQDLQLATHISETGVSDILICRLNALKRWQETLSLLIAAQNHHLWSDEQWLWIHERLSQKYFPDHIPATLFMERDAHCSWFKSQANEDPTLTLGRLDPSFFGRLPPLSLWKVNIYWVVKDFMQAHYIKQVSLLHQAYLGLIPKAERIVMDSVDGAWNGLDLETPRHEMSSYGLLSTMMTPSLGKAYLKFFDTQLQLEMAKVSIQLERYYLSHQSYPEGLEALVPKWIPALPMDPMSAQPFHYRRLEPDGFELYSVGWNGSDDGGLPGHQEEQPFFNYAPKGKHHPDDMLWRVDGRSETLPILLIDANEGEDDASSPMMDIEMMKRYGLLPMDFEE